MKIVNIYKVILITLLSICLVFNITKFIIGLRQGYYSGYLSLIGAKDIPFNLVPYTYDNEFNMRDADSHCHLLPSDYKIVAYGYTKDYVAIQYLDSNNILSYIVYDGIRYKDVNEIWIQEHIAEMKQWFNLYTQNSIIVHRNYLSLTFNILFFLLLLIGVIRLKGDR